MPALSSPDGAPRRPSRFRTRYRFRLRRALPALVLLLALSVLAGGVWLRVLDRVDAGAARRRPPAATARRVRSCSRVAGPGLQLHRPGGAGPVGERPAARPRLRGDQHRQRPAHRHPGRARRRRGPVRAEGRQAGRPGAPAGAGREALPGRPGGRRGRPGARAGVQAAGHRGRAGQGPAGAGGWPGGPGSGSDDAWPADGGRRPRSGPPGGSSDPGRRAGGRMRGRARGLAADGGWPGGLVAAAAGSAGRRPWRASWPAWTCRSGRCATCGSSCRGRAAAG